MKKRQSNPIRAALAFRAETANFQNCRVQIVKKLPNNSLTNKNLYIRTVQVFTIDCGTRQWKETSIWFKNTQRAQNRESKVLSLDLLNVLESRSLNVTGICKTGITESYNKQDTRKKFILILRLLLNPSQFNCF